MTITSIGYKCKNIQEGKVLFTQLEKMGYSTSVGCSTSASNISKGLLSLFVSTEEKICYWFADLHEAIFDVDYLATANTLTQALEAIKDMMDWCSGKAPHEVITPEEFWGLSPKDCCVMARRMSDARFEEMLDYPLDTPTTYGQSIANIMGLKVSTDFKREEVE